MADEQLLKFYENTPDSSLMAIRIGWVKTNKPNSELRGYRKNR